MKFAVAIFFAFALSASCEEQSVNLLADPAPPGPSPDPQPDPASLEALCLRGTNLSGAEFGQVPGQYGADYIYPTFSQSGWNGASRFQSLGLNTFRLPIRWSRLQPSLYGALDPAESERLVTAMDELTELGTVVLDLHNYGRYEDLVLGDSLESRALSDVWIRISELLDTDQNIIFGLMNEPHDIPPDTWALVVQNVIDDLRGAGVQNILMVPGTNWSGAHSWDEGTPSNASALAMVDDPLDRIVFEAHQYLDPTSAGISETCVSPDQAIGRLQPFTDWLVEHGKLGFLGEFSTSGIECEASLRAMLEHMSLNSEYVGWTFWSAGPWWPDDYPFQIFSDRVTPERSALIMYACPTDVG